MPTFEVNYRRKIQKKFSILPSDSAIKPLTQNLNLTCIYLDSLVAQLVKKPPNTGDPGSTLGRSPWEENGNPLGTLAWNLMDRGACQLQSSLFFAVHTFCSSKKFFSQLSDDCMTSVMPDSATPWTAACQAPLPPLSPWSLLTHVQLSWLC